MHVKDAVYGVSMYALYISTSVNLTSLHVHDQEKFVGGYDAMILLVRRSSAT